MIKQISIRKIKIRMHILLALSISLSFISIQTMQKQKNRGCTNQVVSALAWFFEYAGKESLHRYDHSAERYKNHDAPISEKVLHCAYVYSSTKESLAQQAKLLCLQKKGLHFLRSSNIFAAAISKESHIDMDEIIKGLQQKYGAHVTSSADNDGYFFQGTIDADCTNLAENLQQWMS